MHASALAMSAHCATGRQGSGCAQGRQQLQWAALPQVLCKLMLLPLTGRAASVVLCCAGADAKAQYTLHLCARRWCHSHQPAPAVVRRLHQEA